MKWSGLLSIGDNSILDKGGKASFLTKMIGNTDTILMVDCFEMLGGKTSCFRIGFYIEQLLYYQSMSISSYWVLISMTI